MQAGPTPADFWRRAMSVWSTQTKLEKKKIEKKQTPNARQTGHSQRSNALRLLVKPKKQNKTTYSINKRRARGRASGMERTLRV
jgi:hypothetical protein